MSLSKQIGQLPKDIQWEILCHLDLRIGVIKYEEYYKHYILSHLINDESTIKQLLNKYGMYISENWGINYLNIVRIMKNIDYYNSCKYSDLLMMINKVDTESIHIDNIEYFYIPEYIDQIKNLKTIFITSKLIELPHNFGNLIHLTSVILKNNLMSELPKSFSKLTSLIHLDLSYNLFKIFPLVICQLINLEKIFLDFNQIRNIPNQISKLTNLKILNVSHNQDTFRLYHNLKILNLSESCNCI